MFEASPTALRKEMNDKSRIIVVGQNFDKETVDFMTTNPANH